MVIACCVVRDARIVVPESLTQRVGNLVSPGEEHPQ